MVEQTLDPLMCAQEFNLLHRDIKPSNIMLPMPAVIGIVFVLLLTTALIGSTVGIFTRINAAILFTLTAFALIGSLHLSPNLNPQSLILYLALFLALVCGGAGRVSLDYLLTRKKKEK